MEKLVIQNLQIVYNNAILAINGLSLEVAAGSIVALLGANGAGKTTTLRSITGLLKSLDGEVKKGVIEFNQIKLNGLNPAEIVRLGLALVPEGRRIFDELTVRENIFMGAYLRRGDHQGIKSDMEKVLIYFPILRERLMVQGGYLSGGEQQMLAIARALMSHPKLLMLDEPSMGLAPLLIKEIFHIIKQINEQEKVAILLVEQNAFLALNTSRYGYIMENGRIVLDGYSDKLLQHHDVKEFYLGLAETGESKSYLDVKSYKRKKKWMS